MRKPPKGAVWIHVDRLDREDCRVWAVQHWVDGRAIYETVYSVVLQAPGFTQFSPGERRQPRAVIVVPEALVRVMGGVATVSRLTGEP